MSGPLLKIATCPANCVGPESTVLEAVKQMVEARIGAVAVVDEDTLVGIFTERDLMRKVVHEGKDPSAVPIAEVMVKDPVCVTDDTARKAALDLMIKRHFRHLPVLDKDGKIEGMLSIRDLLQHQVHRLEEDVQSLEQYLLADGPGG